MLAFGPSSLFAARVEVAGGSWALQETAHRTLPADLLSFSPVEPNVRSVSELARLSGATLEGVGCRGGRVAVILSDLAVRAFALPVQGRLRPDDMLGLVASRLPYPKSEAVFDTWSGTPKSALVAAVRRAVLQQYQQALDAVGCQAAWVDGASLIMVPQWTREAAEDAQNGSAPLLRVHVQLYSRHYSLAIIRQGDLADFRVKLGGSDDGARLVHELGRLPNMTGGGEFQEISVQGEGAAGLARLIEDDGLAKGHLRLGDDGGDAHLAALTLALTRRM